MAKISHHGKAIGFCWLILAALIGLGIELFRPGHHVHIGSGERLHHHHFFLGSHTHDKPSKPAGSPATVPTHTHTASEHDRHSHAHRSPADHQPGSRHPSPAREPEEPHEPAQDPESSRGLITTFALDMPNPVFSLPAGMAIETPALRISSCPDFVSPVFLPSGARAPPAPSLV